MSRGLGALAMRRSTKSAAVVGEGGKGAQSCPPWQQTVTPFSEAHTPHVFFFFFYFFFTHPTKRPFSFFNKSSEAVLADEKACAQKEPAHKVNYLRRLKTARDVRPREC